MSERNELDLDAILAEYHREEQKPTPAPQAAVPTRRERAAQAQRESKQQEDVMLSSEQKAGEGTMVYQTRVARTEEKPAPAQPVYRPRPAVQEPKEPTPAQNRRREKSAPRAKKKPRQGKGFALMLLVLALLAAALFGLVRWTVRAEKAAAPSQPEALRLELGAELERALDESASSSR